MLGDRERCIEAGMTGYLAKPVRIEALQAALEDLPGPDPAAPEAGRPA
jgi:CheY-like chemotaxis protein